MMGVPFRRAAVWSVAVAVAIGAFGFRFITVRDLPNDHYMQDLAALLAILEVGS